MLRSTGRASLQALRPASYYLRNVVSSRLQPSAALKVSAEARLFSESQGDAASSDAVRGSSDRPARHTHNNSNNNTRPHPRQPPLFHNISSSSSSSAPRFNFSFNASPQSFSKFENDLRQLHRANDFRRFFNTLSNFVQQGHKPTVEIYDLAISAMGHQQLGHRAFKLYEEMMQNGYEPALSTLEAVMEAQALSNNSELASRIDQAASRTSGLLSHQRSEFYYDQLVLAHTRGGNLHAAVNAMQHHSLVVPAMNSFRLHNSRNSRPGLLDLLEYLPASAFSSPSSNGGPDEVGLRSEPYATQRTPSPSPTAAAPESSDSSSDATSPSSEAGADPIAEIMHAVHPSKSHSHRRSASAFASASSTVLTPRLSTATYLELFHAAIEANDLHTAHIAFAELALRGDLGQSPSGHISLAEVPLAFLSLACKLSRTEFADKMFHYINHFLPGVQDGVTRKPQPLCRMQPHQKVPLQTSTRLSKLLTVEGGLNLIRLCARRDYRKLSLYVQLFAPVLKLTDEQWQSLLEEALIYQESDRKLLKLMHMLGEIGNEMTLTREIRDAISDVARRSPPKLLDHIHRCLIRSKTLQDQAALALSASASASASPSVDVDVEAENEEAEFEAGKKDKEKEKESSDDERLSDHNMPNIKPSLELVDLLLGANASMARFDKTFQILAEMHDFFGYRPTIHTYHSLLHLTLHTGKHDVFQIILNNMERDTNVHPLAVTKIYQALGCMLRGDAAECLTIAEACFKKQARRPRAEQSLPIGFLIEFSVHAIDRKMVDVCRLIHSYYGSELPVFVIQGFEKLYASSPSSAPAKSASD